MEEGEKKTSKFSGALAQIYRLDELWKSVNRTSVQDSYSKWNTYLDRIWCELSRDLTSEEDFEESYKGKIRKEKKPQEKTDYEIYEETLKKFDKQIKDKGGFMDSLNQGFKKASASELKKREEVYYILMAKELFLRRLENYLGKGTSYDDEDDMDFD